jgi:4a-hydroxytetrahydrobiopterin dehydratase
MKISQADIAERMKTLHGWRLEQKAIAFVNRLVPEAEAADHHPDIHINYKRVALVYSTHSEGGLTDKDFAGAAMADRIAAR